MGSVFEISATENTNFYDTIDSVILQNGFENGEKLSESQKDACLLWASWKSQVGSLLIFKRSHLIFVKCSYVQPLVSKRMHTISYA